MKRTFVISIVVSLLLLTISFNCSYADTISFTVDETAYSSICGAENIETPKITLPKPKFEKPKKTYLGEYKITYYCACDTCCGNCNGITASGTTVCEDRTIAAPGYLEFGTKVLINGKQYIVEDRGGSINENHIDIYCESHSECLQRGVDYYSVYILE